MRFIPEILLFLTHELIGFLLLIHSLFGHWRVHREVYDLERSPLIDGGIKELLLPNADLELFERLFRQESLAL